MATSPKKKRSFKLDKAEVVKKVLEWYDQDIRDRADWTEKRLQRYAKLRGWLEPKNYPWPNAANTHNSLLSSNSQRTQDTLVNAVLASRPVMSPQAVHDKDAPKEETISNLIDYQLFVEQQGEESLQQAAISFVDDGQVVAFTPWIKDKRQHIDVRTIPAPDAGMDEQQYFLSILQEQYPQAVIIPKGEEDPYNFTISIEGEDEITVDIAYDEYDEVVITSKQNRVVYDGPLALIKQLEDVVIPSRAANLQPPSPSNPKGAHHVFLVDYPSRDEIKRLHRSGYYDLLTDDEMEEFDGLHQGLRGTNQGDDPEAHKNQRDALAGLTSGTSEVSAEFYTRIMCFVPWDVDDDGLEEQVVFWIIVEAKKLLRARYLSELFPSENGRRPLASEAFIPVQDEFYGIGMLELVEHSYDLIKTLFDQAIDKQTINNTPFGFYRAASGTRPEVIRFMPGDLYPLANPSEDVVFPQMPNADQATAMNFIAFVQQNAERESMQGELQFGRVPYGKASALRTQGTTMALLQQGDARPERILRRFFLFLAQIFQNFHTLNQAYLKPGKMFRIVNPKPDENPYQTVKKQDDIRGGFQFEFSANVLNTNKGMFSQIMTQLAGALLNPLTMQLGLVTPDKAYNIISDFVKAHGQDPNRYLNTPPQAGVVRITLDEALGMLVNGQMPMGQPAEGASAQLEMLATYDERGDARLMMIQLDPGNSALLNAYVDQLKQLATQEMQQQAMMQAAQQFQSAMGAGQGGQGGQQGMPQNPQMTAPTEANELQDESLPGAGGGASAQV